VPRGSAPTCSQEKMREWQKQLEALTSQVSQLMNEKSQLETRTRILEQIVVVNTHHEERLHCNKVGGACKLGCKQACTTDGAGPPTRVHSGSYAWLAIFCEIKRVCLACHIGPSASYSFQRAQKCGGPDDEHARHCRDQ
jgi:hypothetical protein